MLVDWFTTVAQIVNFLILVWLLKRFLYKPTLRAMDEREQRMVKALRDAEEQKSHAENERRVFEKKCQELAEEKDQVLKSATLHAEEERKKMVSVAREDVARLEAQWRTAIDHEKAARFDEFTTRIKNEIFAISRQALSDLANVDLETSIAERFTKRLKSLEPGERDRLVASVRTSPSAVVIRSAFEIAENNRRRIEEAVREILGAVPIIQFVIASELIGGIELITNGHKVSWTIQSYLSSLSLRLADKPLPDPLLQAGSEEVTQTGGVAHVQ
jgi:F-type H+-transporting ATPase subunit b